MVLLFVLCVDMSTVCSIPTRLSNISDRLESWTLIHLVLENILDCGFLTAILIMFDVIGG